MIAGEGVEGCIEAADDAEVFIGFTAIDRLLAGVALDHVADIENDIRLNEIKFGDGGSEIGDPPGFAGGAVGEDGDGEG